MLGYLFICSFIYDENACDELTTVNQKLVNKRFQAAKWEAATSAPLLSVP